MTAKISLVVPSFPKTSETFIVSKFLGLLTRGYDVKVICGSSDPKEWGRFPDLERAELKRRVLVSPLASPRWRAALHFPFVLLRTLVQRPAATARYLRRGWPVFGPDVFKRLYLDAHLIVEQPDLIHFEFGALAVNRTYLGKLLGCKILVSFRGYDLNFSGLDQPHYYEDVWRQADAFHFLGEDLRHRALRRGCPPDKPYALIPPAIDIEKFIPPEAKQDAESEPRPLRLLSVGRMEWKKGYEYALQAIACLVKQGVVVEHRIVGGGSYLQAVAFCRHDLGLEDHVTFLGALTAEQVREQMAWADVFVHAAVSEGFCNAVLEAQAMQLPVVCTDADGLPENVADGVTGFVVPRRDARALAGKIAVLAANPVLRARMGQAGRERVEERFQVADQLDAFERLYSRLVDL